MLRFCCTADSGLDRALTICSHSPGGWRLEGRLGNVVQPLPGTSAGSTQQALATTGTTVGRTCCRVSCCRVCSTCGQHPALERHSMLLQ